MSRPFLRILLADIRSCHNVGAILRTADAVGVEEVVFCGYTPYPRLSNDSRPEHIIGKNTRAIAKTSLGAEGSLAMRHEPDLEEAIRLERNRGCHVAALERSKVSTDLFTFTPPPRISLILGNETEGIDPGILSACDSVLAIPMLGHKESLNVSVAAGVALYQLVYGRR